MTSMALLSNAARYHTSPRPDTVRQRCLARSAMTRVVPFKHLPLRTRLKVIAAGLCPRCRGGRIFRGRLAMNETCPACGLRFERESGYFTGAMYVSYILALPVIAVCW